MAQVRHEPGYRSSDQTQGGQQQSSAMIRDTESRGRSLSRRSRESFLPSQSLDPFAFTRRFMEDIDRMFGDFGMSGFLAPYVTALPRAAGTGGAALAQGYWRPQIEVREREGEIVMRADLPGLSAHDVRLEIEDDMLAIEGERQDEQEEARGNVYHSERSYGFFRRTIQLPEGVDPDRVEATFNNGVLEVRIPTPKRKGRPVEIKGGAGTKAIGAGEQGARDRTAATAGGEGGAGATTGTGKEATGREAGTGKEAGTSAGSTHKSADATR